MNESSCLLVEIGYCVHLSRHKILLHRARNMLKNTVRLARALHARCEQQQRLTRNIPRKKNFRIFTFARRDLAS